MLSSTVKLKITGLHFTQDLKSKFKTIKKLRQLRIYRQKEDRPATFNLPGGRQANQRIN